MSDRNASASNQDARSGTSAPSGPSSVAPQGDAPRPKRRGPPPNPLYHPLFLPVLLVAFCLWFGWDGFMTTDPEMLEHQGFNRVMFGLTAAMCLWIVPRGIREHREEQAAAAARQAGGNSN